MKISKNEVDNEPKRLVWGNKYRVKNKTVYFDKNEVVVLAILTLSDPYSVKVVNHRYIEIVKFDDLIEIDQETLIPIEKEKIILELDINEFKRIVNWGRLVEPNSSLRLELQAFLLKEKIDNE